MLSKLDCKQIVLSAARLFADEHGYIDPGTGSMLFTILIGVISAGVYALRNALVKLRFFFSGGRQDKSVDETLPFVIFSDSKRYWNVFQSICDEFEKREIQLRYYTASPDDPALGKAYRYITREFIGEGNRAFARMNMIKADVVLSSTPGLDVYQWKRSRDVKWYVHIPHALTDMTMYRMFGIDYYDAMLLNGAYQIDQVRKLEQMRGLPEKELVLVGSTTTDALAEKLQGTEPARQSGAPTILLAPSWGPSSIFSRYGSRIIEALTSTNYHVIIRPHPQSFISEKKLLEDLMANFPASDTLEWNQDDNNFDVLSRSDIMISDFSGVILDFALAFDKPVIYTEAEVDLAPYDACWLDESPWVLTTLPRIGMPLKDDDMDDIGRLVEECLTNPRFQQGRKQVRSEGWCFIGKSASLVTDYLVNKQRELGASEAESSESAD